jgi:hypothetical protein
MRTSTRSRSSLGCEKLSGDGLAVTDRYERALLTAVSVMSEFAGEIPSPLDERAAQMRKADEILRAVEPDELVTVALLLGALGTWGICTLVPLHPLGVEPKDWILGYVQSAFLAVDERG